MGIETDWYVYRDHQRYGPYSWQRMLEGAKSGNIKPTDQLWHPQYPDFIDASQVQGLFDSTNGNELEILPVQQNGNTIVSQNPTHSEWEIKDLYIPMQPGGWVSAEYYTAPSARLHYWQLGQTYFLPEFQKLFDAGWEPISEVGPACIQLRSYKSSDSPDAWGIFGMIILVIFTYGIGLIAIPFIWPRSWKFEMIGLQLKFRRRRNR